jgi:hypothetical protein
VDKTGVAILKIAITGHTSGFGKYIYQELAKEHEVIGFSKNNGYNLNTDVKNIIAECKDVDILINNACSRMCQIDILLEFYSRYNLTNKKIINIGSWITQVQNIDAKFFYAQKQKQILQQLSHTLIVTSNCKIIYKSWGFHKGNELLEYYPELEDKTTIEEAVQELISW